MRRIDYLWRLAATGASFAFVFFGGGLLAATLLPLLALAPGHQRERAQFLVHSAFRFYVEMLQVLGLLRLEIEGIERLSHCGGRMIVANHPSLLDVVMLMALIPKTQCIVKAELWNHPLLGGVMRRAGYLRNDMDPEELVAACRVALDAGNCLIIFPEGTRTQPGALPHFRRGFANLATMTHAPIQPVFISCQPPTLIKGEPWWRIPATRPLFRVAIDDCLPTDWHERFAHRSLASRSLVKSLETYYADKLQNA